MIQSPHHEQESKNVSRELRDCLLICLGAIALAFIAILIF